MDLNPASLPNLVAFDSILDTRGVALMRQDTPAPTTLLRRVHLFCDS